MLCFICWADHLQRKGREVSKWAKRLLRRDQKTEPKNWPIKRRKGDFGELASLGIR